MDAVRNTPAPTPSPQKNDDSQDAAISEKASLPLPKSATALPSEASGSRMASAKSSRSRPAGHSGVFPVGAAATGAVGGGGGGGGGGDGGVQLADKLKIFKTDKFDPDSYVQSKCQTMTEKVSQSGEGPPAGKVFPPCSEIVVE